MADHRLAQLKPFDTEKFRIGMQAGADAFRRMVVAVSGPINLDRRK